MQLFLAESVLRAVAAAGVAAYPRECCGILLGRFHPDRAIATHAIIAPNIAELGEQHQRYILDPLVFLRAQRVAEAMGTDIVGFYHSHPDHPAQPSVFDAEHAWQGYFYVIVCITREGPQEVRAYGLCDDQSAVMREIPLVLVSEPDSAF